MAWINGRGLSFDRLRVGDAVRVVTTETVLKQDKVYILGALTHLFVGQRGHGFPIVGTTNHYLFKDTWEEGGYWEKLIHEPTDLEWIKWSARRWAGRL